MQLGTRYTIVRLRKFNFRLIFRLTGVLLLILTATMLLPLAASLYYRDGAQFELLLSAAIILIVGLLFRNILGRTPNFELHEKESFWTTVIVWSVVPLMGTLPYLTTGAAATFTDALFESMSGFTTTGSSVMQHLDTLPRGLIVWRAVTQWIGGVGLLMFIVALLRRLNVGGTQLYEAEFSGTMQRKLHPRIASSVGKMWRVYGGLTLLLIAVLLACGNSLFESFCVGLSAVSTGGFLPSDAGLTHFNILSLVALTVAMFLGGVNIALLYRLFSGHADLLRDSEFRLYVALFLGSATVGVVVLRSLGYPVGRSVGYAFFHVASTLSTCGLCLPTPGGKLPVLLAALTFVLIVTGASSGSTGGGIKLKRIMILHSYVYNYFVRMLHPRAVRVVKINGTVVPDTYVKRVVTFVFLYIAFVLGGAFVLTLCGVDIPGALCLAAANLSNLGPSPLIGSVSGGFSYAALPALGKWVLIVLMLAGRVEIFALLAVLSPAYWKR